MGIPNELCSDVNSSIFEFFPPEIIVEILSRLPVKALGRFSIVSKSWHSLIKSRMFINQHFNNYCISLANKPCTSCESHSSHVLHMPTVLRENERYSYSLYCDSTFVQHGKFDIPRVSNWLELLSIANSCNGIICFTDWMNGYSGRHVCLYNPSIRKLKFVSYSCFSDTIYDRQRVYSKLGFGYSELTSDFKIVRINYIKDANLRMLGDVAPEVEVYSVNADDWRSIGADVKCIVDQRSVCCSGSVYWLARRTNESIVDAIMCFDISHDVFSEIELPVKCNSFLDGNLLVFKGSLALFKKGTFSERDIGRVKCYELWVMRGYRWAESWTKSEILTDKSVVKAFGFTKTEKLVVQVEGDVLATWDPKGNFVEHRNLDARVRHVDPAFVGSLIFYDGE